MLALIDQTPEEGIRLCEELTTLGIEHEKQHQELLVMDIKYIYAHNPLEPLYSNDKEKMLSPVTKVSSSKQITFSDGTYSFGHEKEGFSYDNERPFHKAYLQPFRLSSLPVTNGEFLEFIEDGGYQNPNLWHSDGWDFLNRDKVKAPLYWFKRDDRWLSAGLEGVQVIDPYQTLSHISYFEASAYARWKGRGFQLRGSGSKPRPLLILKRWMVTF